MRMACLGLLLCCWLASPQFTFARDIHVNNVTGDDRNDGSLPTNESNGVGPCRTITRALKHARKGDRIVLAKTDVPYRESITLQGGRHSGGEVQPFVIIGNGAVLDGSAPVKANAWKHHTGDIFRFRPDYLTSQQLFQESRPLQRVELEDAPTMDDLEPMQWGLHGGYVYFRAEESRIPQEYDLSHSKLPVGIALYCVRNVQIVDLTVQGFVLDGINAHDSVYETIVGGVIARGNGRSGISIGGASKVQLQACLIGNNSDVQVRGEGVAQVEIKNCDIIADDPIAPAFERESKVQISIDGTVVAD